MILGIVVRALVLSLLAGTALQGGAAPARARSCPGCATVLALDAEQWACLRTQLLPAVRQRRDPRRFSVGGCRTSRMPLSPPPCIGCAPDAPIGARPPAATILLSLGQQRCLLAQPLPSGVVDLARRCRRW